jgi:uncharacterized membrane protein
MDFKILVVDTKKTFKLSWQILPLLILFFIFISYAFDTAWLMIGTIPAFILVMYWVISSVEYPIEIIFSDTELQIDTMTIPFDQILRYSIDEDSVLTENVSFELQNKTTITLVVSTKKQNKIVFDAFKKYLEEKVKV